MKNPRKIIRINEVKSRVGKCRATIYRGMAAGTFPLAVKMGENSIGWFEDEIDGHINSLPRVIPTSKVEAAESAA